MRRLTSILFLLFMVYILGVAAGCAPRQKVSALQGMPKGAPMKIVHVTAEKYRFTPDTIRVEKGTHLIIELESLDTDHEFRLEGYGIYVDIPAGETARAEIYASREGEFEYGCFLGLSLHYSRGMKGKLIVEE